MSLAVELRYKVICRYIDWYLRVCPPLGGHMESCCGSLSRLVSSAVIRNRSGSTWSYVDWVVNHLCLSEHLYKPLIDECIQGLLKKKYYTQKKIAQLNINFLREPFCKFSPNPETFLMNKYYLALSWTCAIHFLREDAFVLFNCRLLLWPGTSPYPGVSGRDIQKLLRNGYRMEKPENCSQQV